MNSRAFTGLVCTLCLCFSSVALSGYKTLLDPRSMAMGGTGVASASKFNSSYHNPALIAFNRGRKPDKISISSFIGARETYDDTLNSDIRNYRDSEVEEDFADIAPGGSFDEVLPFANRLREQLRHINLNGYRADEVSGFSLLVDTKQVTMNFFTRRDVREMTTLLNRDEEIVQLVLDIKTDPDNNQAIGQVSNALISSVDSIDFKITEFGVTVATTNVINYNMPISWGFSPKLIQINGSHLRTKIIDYDISNPPDQQPSVGQLEWNLDIGFAMLLTDSFIKNELGLDGFWLEGEWVVALVGMNMVPTDFRTFGPFRRRFEFPFTKRAVQALYQVGVAHYREKYMLTLDIDLTENEVFDTEGLTRFISMGGEYYWRDDFHLRAGLRFNAAQTSEGAKDKAIFTTGFLYQPRGFSIEAAFLANDVEIGGSIGFGLAF